MKFIDSNVTEYIQEPGIDGMYKAVMEAALSCYQNEIEKSTYTPKEFVENVIIKRGHGRALEFGTVYLKIPDTTLEIPNPVASRIPLRHEKYQYNIWTHKYHNPDGYWYITTNLRVLIQGWYRIDEEACANGYDKNWLYDLEFWCEPTEHHDKRRTFSMNMCRGCTDDNRTHIALSSMAESTRWCNYTKNKFGNELTFVWPYWLKKEDMIQFNNKTGKLYSEYSEMLRKGISYDSTKQDATLLVSFQHEEDIYMNIVGKHGFGLQPQQGKRFLPLGIKTQLFLCGFDEAWSNFFWRRCNALEADPECVFIANKLKEMYYNK